MHRGNQPINARTLAADCGGRHYAASAEIADVRLFNGHGGIPMDYILDHVAHSLAHKIVNDSPNNLMVERTVNDQDARPYHLPFGATQYRTDVMVFSLKNFDIFVEELLKRYGNQYAEAALHTKKESLKKNVSAVIDRS